MLSAVGSRTPLPCVRPTTPPTSPSAAAAGRAVGGAAAAAGAPAAGAPSADRPAAPAGPGAPDAHTHQQPHPDLGPPLPKLQAQQVQQALQLQHAQAHAQAQWLAHAQGATLERGGAARRSAGPVGVWLRCTGRLQRPRTMAQRTGRSGCQAQVGRSVGCVFGEHVAAARQPPARPAFRCRHHFDRPPAHTVFMPCHAAGSSIVDCGGQRRNSGEGGPEGSSSAGPSIQPGSSGRGRTLGRVWQCPAEGGGWGPAEGRNRQTATGRRGRGGAGGRRQGGPWVSGWSAWKPNDAAAGVAVGLAQVGQWDGVFGVFTEGVTAVRPSPPPHKISRIHAAGGALGSCGVPGGGWRRSVGEGRDGWVCGCCLPVLPAAH